MVRSHFYRIMAIAGLALLCPLLQGQSNCFMQDGNGRSIDLGGLCRGNSPVSPDTSPKVIQIPIKRRLGGIPTVNITFNGKSTFEMLFDTGASGIVITTDMAQVLGLKPTRSAYTQTAGGVVPVGVANAHSVSAGGLVVKNVPVIINPSHSMELGLLGQSFYGNHDVIIKEKVIELHRRP